MDEFIKFWFCINKISNAPKSIHDVIKRIDDNKNWVNEIPDTFKTEIKSFWKNHGEKIREYRVIDQHYHILTYHARIIFENKLPVKFVVDFPDNCHERSISKYTYNLQYDGIEISKTCFHRLLELIDNNSYNGNKEVKPLQFQMNFQPGIHASKSPGNVLGIVFYDDFGEKRYIFYQTPDNTVGINWNVKAINMFKTVK